MTEKKYVHYPIHYSREEYRRLYLSSPEWREKSKNILNRDKICKICEKNKSTDAHHLTYAKLGNENLDIDVIGVCRVCHNIIHHYKELEDVQELSYLKELFSKLQKEYFIESDLYNKIIHDNAAVQRKIASVLKITVDELLHIQGKQVGFFTLRKILKCFHGKNYTSKNQHSKLNEIGLIRKQAKLKRKYHKVANLTKRKEILRQLRKIQEILDIK